MISSLVKSIVLGFLIVSAVIGAFLIAITVIQALFGGVAAGTFVLLLILSPAFAVVGWVVRDEWHERKQVS